MKYSLLSIWFTLSILLLVNNSYSQTEKWMNFSKNDDLRKILDDGDYLWVSSSNGLVKYQKSLKSFMLYNASNSGLLENRVGVIAKDQTGNLWISTLHEGCVVFDGENWIEVDSVNNYLSDSPSDVFHISCIYIDDENIKWITSDKGLIKIDESDTIVLNESNSNIPTDDLLSIIKTNNGFYWLGGRHELIKYDGINWEVFTYADTNLPQYGHYKELKRGNNNDIWCISTTNLVKIDSNAFYTFHAPFNQYLYSIEIDQYDTVWIGKGEGDYSYFQFHNELWYSFDNSNCGVANEYVSMITGDSDNIKWFVGDKGLDKRSPNNTWEFTELSNSELPANRINSVATDKNGTNFICTWWGSVSYNWSNWNNHFNFNSDQVVIDNNESVLFADPDKVYIYKDGVLDTISTPFIGRAIEQVRDIKVDKSNNIWMTYPNDYYNYMKGGVFMYDGSNWTNYNKDNCPLPSYYISEIAVDAYSNVWFATPKGLVKFKDEEWTVYDKDNSQMPYNVVSSVTVDSENNIWISQLHETLTKFDGENWITYDPQISYSSSLKNICIDSKGNIWGVTLFQLIKFDLNSWSYFDAHNTPLTHGNLLSLHIDQNDNLFIGSTGNGLYIFNEDGINPITNINEGKSSNLLIYPNPSSGKLYINKSSLVNTKDIEINIYDIAGRLITHESNNLTDQLMIKLNNYDRGIYIIQVKTSNNTLSEKVIIY